MKERGPWRFWILTLLLAVNLCIQVTECQSYNEGGPRGDDGGNPQSLGFDDVLRRHDGYVKGETPTIPQTSFSCSAQPHNPGLYADTETQCQVYHVCFEDRQESFLCGPGTNFNQRILACDFWYNFNCEDSPSFYNVNADIGKVPDAVFKPGQSRDPQPQQPSYPNYPRQPEQPPSGGSYPTRVSVPPPPPRIDPQPQRPNIQPPKVDIQRPEIPVFQPESPRGQPEPPRIPQVPRIPPQPQPPRINPQPQRPPFQPQPEPQRPHFQPQPQRPSFQPQPQPQRPSFQPQPQPQRPSFQPQPQPQRPPFQPQPPIFRPQPDPPTVVKPQYPPQPSGHGSGNRQPYPPSIQQEDDSEYQFDGYNPPKPISLPPPPPTHPQTPIPAFPAVISPPRVSRPPLTPPVIRHPEGSVSRPRIPANRPDFHPDSNLKGNVDYQPPHQSRVPQPSRPVGSGYPSYPVAQRPVSPRPIPQRPVNRPAYVPPPAVQQEHVEPEYVPPPPPRQPSRPPTSFVPPPPIQQEVTVVGPPPKPSRPTYVPPPIPQRPIDSDYGRPQPPVAPSIISEQQKPASRPPSRPQVSVGVQQPQRPKPVFPPPSDHPNSNIKGGPGYNQPPPQIPRFEPTRIGRPSSPQPVRPHPEISANAVKPAGEKRPSASTSGGIKTPHQERIKKPSEPQRDIYQPPIQVIDHPQSEIKGGSYRDPPQPPQRIKSPSTSVSGIKVPQGSTGRQQPQVQRPRAPVVVRRPQPPSLPTTSIKKTSPVDSNLYEKTRPQPPAQQPARVKQPSQIQSVHQPRFPSHQPVDHPNANIKGGSGYNQPRPQGRPSGPPSSPSTSYEQKTTSNNQRQPSGSGYPSPPYNPCRGGDCGSVQQEFKPQRRPQPSGVKTASPSGVKTVSHPGIKATGNYQRPQSASQQGIGSRVPKPDYDSGTSYTRGPDIYPKPEFGQPNSPYQPISTPSRSSQITKQGSPSQNTFTQAQNKPTYQGSPATSGSGAQVRPDYPFGVPGHQPPHQPQLFPHRENPDHPNESLKGSGAYRPPPPAGFQAAASEVKEQKAEPEPEATPLLGDIGAE